MARQPDTPCAGCGKLLWSSRTSLPPGQRRCRDCRRDAPPVRRKSCATCGDHFYARASQAKYCSRDCSNRRNGWSQRGQRQCEICDATYTASYNDQRTCSKTCGGQLRRRESPAPRVPHGPPAPKQYRPGRSVRVFFPYCSVCAASFATPYTVSTCSDACAEEKKRRDKRQHKDLRRARKRGAFVAAVYRRDIFERDQWRCQLCDKPVRRNAVVPHPLAPTLDHIVPLAAGGTHEPANCQLAHYLCNSRKGAAPADDQLRLIG